MKRLFAIMLCLSLILTGCGGCNEAEESTTDLIGEQYDTKDLIQTANEKYEDSKEASVFTGVSAASDVSGLCFEGIPAEKTLDKILKLLKKYDVKSTFFVQGVKSAEDTTVIKKIKDAGHDVENYTLEATKQMEKLEATQIITDFVKTSAVINAAVGKNPSYIRVNATELTKKVKKAAKACGLTIVKPTYYLSYQSLKKQSETTGFVEQLKNGKILTIKLDSVLDATEFEKEREEEKPADDKQAGIESEEETKSEDELLVNVVSMVLKAGKKTERTFLSIKKLKKYTDSGSADYSAIQTSNGGRKAAVIKNINTSKSYVGLTFRSLGSKANVTKALSMLSAKGMKATFFVTGNDIKKHPDWVKLIISKGHEIGNGGLTGKTLTGKNFKIVCTEMKECKTLLKKKFNISAKYFMPADAKVNNTILEAASAMGYTVGSYNKNPSASSPSNYFRNGFQHGDLISISLSNCSSNIGGILQVIASKAATSSYRVVTLKTLQSVAEAKKSLTSIPGWNAVKVNKNWQNTTFNSSRVVEKVNTTKKVVFFTFDDWGSDSTITKLLAQLRKYNIHATFFVRGNGVAMNPTLLKQISNAGQEIGNHTFNHLVLTTLSKTALQKEVVKCHQTITQAIGKKPTLYFRPPTMETSDAINKAILATGIKYIVRGVDLSTHDYERTPTQVTNFVMKNIEPGGIITMHMSDNSCAVRAIPMLVKQLKKEGYSIGKLGDYLK